MTPKARARVLWAMACLVLVYALVNVVVYFVSGTFGAAWFVASLVVYGGALAAALILLAADKEREPNPVATVQVMNVQGSDLRSAASTPARATSEAIVVAPPSDLVVADDTKRP